MYSGSFKAVFASDLRRATALLTATSQPPSCSFSTTGNLIMSSAFSSKAETLTSTLELEVSGVAVSSTTARGPSRSYTA